MTILNKVQMCVNVLYIYICAMEYMLYVTCAIMYKVLLLFPEFHSSGRSHGRNEFSKGKSITLMKSMQECRNHITIKCSTYTT